MKSTLEAALSYAARGWHVIALAPRGKEPAIPRDRGGRGVLDATTDTSTIRALWRQYPGANVGIATGHVSGLVVVDVDGDKLGDETMRALVAEHGPIPRTMTARTGAGWHLLFRAPASPVRSAANVLGRGVDTRGEGGYVVAPPSIHPSGRAYRWIADVEPAPLPSWIADAAAPRVAPPAPALPQRAPADVIDRAVAYLRRIDPSVQGQNGSGRLMWAAVALVRGFALDDGAALDLLASEFNPRCQPPWSDRELSHKVESAERFTRYEIGFLLNAPKGRAAR